MPRAFTTSRLTVFLRGSVVSLLALLAMAGAASADPYTLGVEDKIHVRVVEWKPVDATLLEWTAIDGDYVVGPSGMVAFPFVGETASAGKTTAELATAISSGLRQALGLPNAPDVSVEVSQFGPVYVTGDVQTPGKYDFAPGLNVIKSVSLAGGERHSADVSTRADRDLIDLQGAYDVLVEQRVRLLITRARLDAELAGKSDFALPDGVTADDKTAQLVSIEKSVMVADEQQITSQLDALNAQTTMLNGELQVLQQKRDSTSHQLQVVQDQLGKVRGLASNGLAANDRVNAAESDVSDVESRGLDIDTAVLQAQQGLGQAQKESVQIQGKHTADLTLQRQQADQQVAELDLKIATQKQLIGEAVAYGDGPTTGENSPVTYTYSIVRGQQQLPATTTTEVEPGDVIVAKLQIAN